ncbi:MAG: flagellar M-ring protein FliF, partial [Deltaproteobacteria bacterium]|nr:flagellar M-ring protein FliF [Deltaproteobacteria bacterium]
YEIGRTVVHSNTKGYRLTKLSVALLVDGADGKARPDEELQQLAELAKRAVGFDPARGDQLEIKSSVFTRSTEPEPAPAKPEGFSLTKSVPPWAVPVGGGALLAVIIVMMLLMMRRKAADSSAAMPQLKSGESVAALEAVLSASPMAQQIAAASPARSADPNISLRDRARELVNKDPSRAALLLRAWLTADEVQHG